MAHVVFALGCGAAPSASDTHINDAPVTDPFNDGRGLSEASQNCETTRTAIIPDSELLATLERVSGSYPLGGTWGAPPPQFDFAPKNSVLEGELVVTRREGEVIELGGACSSGIEVPVSVTVHTDDGALSESLDGIVVLRLSRDRRVDGTPAPFRAELTVPVDLGALSGSFTFTDTASKTLGNAALRAELTPFGTRGSLSASVQWKQPPGPGVAVEPAIPQSLFTWDGGGGCVGDPELPERALYPAPTEERAALDAALGSVATESYRARYADGTETVVTIELEPLSLLCATNFWASYWHFPTRAHLSTEDGRIDVTIGVSIDPGFTLLHYTSLTEVSWAHPARLVSDRIGRIDAEMADYAHVGIESWFDLSPEPAGWAKVLGYAAGACLRCDDMGGCSECAFDARVEVLSLFIGTQAEGS